MTVAATKYVRPHKGRKHGVAHKRRGGADQRVTIQAHSKKAGASRCEQ